MKRRYIEEAKDSNEAVLYWNDSQFEVGDILIALVDNQILEGAKLYALFTNKDFGIVMSMFKIDFQAIKEDLGIYGDYIERKGDIFSTDFNPKRNINALTKKGKDLALSARKFYKEFEEQFNAAIATKIDFIFSKKSKKVN